MIVDRASQGQSARENKTGERVGRGKVEGTREVSRTAMRSGARAAIEPVSPKPEKKHDEEDVC